MGKSSLRNWVEEIPWMQQGVLFSAIRSADGVPHEDVSKIIIRGYRNVVLKPAHDKGSFLGKIPTREKLEEAIKEFCGGFGQYNVHFVLHLIHASEIIGYQHPEEIERTTWNKFYLDMCKEMHLNPETKEQMNNRLKDNPEVTGRY